MASEQQNYSVSYSINVEATKGVEQVNAFANSLKSLFTAKKDMSTVATSMKTMMDDVDKVFKNNGRKRDLTYKFTIDTKKSEENLVRVKTLLTEIQTLAKGIKLVINPGNPIDTKGIRANAKKAINKRAQESQNALNKENAEATIRNFRDVQKNITKSVGKVNAALVSLERGRTINLNTDAAKGKLNEILALIRKIKSGAKGIQLTISGGLQGKGRNMVVDGSIHPYNLPENIRRRMLGRSRQIQERRNTSTSRNIQNRESAEEKAARREEDKQQRQAAQAIRNVQRQLNNTQSINNSQQRAAINRLQYSRAPSFRNMPFAYMLNGYMMYGMMRREFQDAIEYANIMQSAHSILRVADNDLGTFESRFSQMAKNVRQIGVETKFTAVEVAGAVKYLSMAGMNIDTINKSIRPIANLALIGDNDISEIADLTTNIMAGYDVKSDSMNSVADIMSSTISRSNVNILEMAESYKMAAGYLRMSGVEFSESSAAIGILGNMGLKGTLAGTSLRGMSQRFAKQPKEGQKALKRMDIQFTEMVDVYGKQVEKLRPLADIFQELKNKGASVQDMNSIFGRTSANAAMALMNNHEKLRELAVQNRTSHGISDELAKVKQNTTKGLFAQVKSMFSESFMQGFEILEPQIRSVLRDFLEKFKSREFAKGLASIGGVLLDILSVIGKIGNWFIRNFSWIEPLLFTGIVATKLFKLAGALTNVGVALGFLGRQSVASSALQSISGLVGISSTRGIAALSMANKRSLVTALSAAGITGRGRAALIRSLVTSGGSGAIARGALPGLFASQVATGNGLMGAGASISALGAGAVAATAGIAGLVGILGFLAYKTWKVKEAKDAILEDIDSNKKYRYPSIEALHNSLRDTYLQAINTKKAVDDLTSKSVEEEGGPIGAFTSNWWAGAMGTMGSYFNSHSQGRTITSSYDTKDAYQDDVRAAINNIAAKDGQNKINAAWADIAKLRNPLELKSFIDNISYMYMPNESALDPSLYTGSGTSARYVKDFGEKKASDAAKTPHYAEYFKNNIIPNIQVAANAVLNDISSNSKANEVLKNAGLSHDELKNAGYYQNTAGKWVQNALSKNATEQDRQNRKTADDRVKFLLTNIATSIRGNYGGQGEIAERVLETAGFSRRLFSNEPMSNDPTPYNANRITNSHLDDGGSGGNYSGTGKLSSTAPKQVIVNISSLLSVNTIDLMKSKEGKTEEVQDLKEKLAQALIDVVHDFDASWNG